MNSLPTYAKKRQPDGRAENILVHVKLGGSLYGLSSPVVEDVILPAGSSVVNLVEHIAGKKGEEIKQPNTIAVVNGTLITVCNHSGHILKDDDRVSFFCMMVGG